MTRQGEARVFSDSTQTVVANSLPQTTDAITHRKRLVYVINRFPTFTEAMIYREVAELRTLGFDIATFSMRRPEAHEVPAEAHPFRDSTFYILPVPVLRLIVSHLLALLRFRSRYWRALWDVLSGTHESFRDRIRSLCHFAEAVTILKDIERRRIEHVHAHWAVGSTTLVMVVSRFLGLPFSFTAHAYDIWRERLLLPEKLRAANIVMTCTEYNRRHLIEAYGVPPEKIQTVHHGLSVDRFSRRSRPRNDEPVILSVGRLVEQKGHDRLLEACQELRRRGRRFSCKIIGDGPLRTTLQARVAALGLKESVQLMGAVVGDTLLEYYEQADVFALLSLEASDGDRDGIPNVLIEAMAMELPVVATRYSGIPELVVDRVTGLLVEPEDAMAGANALDELLADRARCERMGHAGRERVMAHFTSARSASKLKDVFATEHVRQPAACR
jgi:colanic acid/amylovoran biosynthesis glycosyltransferase